MSILEAEGTGDIAVKMPETLLKKPKSDKINPLLKKSNVSFRSSHAATYDAVGGNGIFTVSPNVARFAGFELKKTHTLKVKLINNSAVPQRLHILPPSTPYFKVRQSSKKGMIPSGISEDIYIQFTPTEYK